MIDSNTQQRQERLRNRRKANRKLRGQISRNGYATSLSNAGGGSQKIQRLFRSFARLVRFPAERSKQQWKALTHVERGIIAKNMRNKMAEIIKAKQEAAATAKAV